jgi:hypothetical protein
MCTYILWGKKEESNIQNWFEISETELIIHCGKACRGVVES